MDSSKTATETRRHEQGAFLSAVPSAAIKGIIKRDGQVVSYDRDRIATAIFKASTAVKTADRKAAEELAKQVEDALVQSFGQGAMPSVEEIQDSVEEILVKSGRAHTARAYIRYRHAREQARQQRRWRVEATDHIPYKKIYEVLRWNMAHGCDSVSGINRIVSAGHYTDLVDACDRRFAQELDAAAEQFLHKTPTPRILIVAGPSSSGKTTTTIKLGKRLAQKGIRLVALNVDHYFFDLEQHPRDAFGDYDYETPQALDLPLINEHLARLLEGQTIRTPHYDFTTGRRTLDAHSLRLEAGQVLIIDSLHGLYQAMTDRVPDAAKFRLYIETLGQVHDERGIFMRWADNRLMRRMLRDSRHRNLQPMETITHWHYVRRSELRHIIPFIGSVDTVINSALPYELPILKKRLFGYFPQGMRIFHDDSHRQDAYLRCKRIYEFLEPMSEGVDDTCIPASSLLREFIGGSAYTYS